MMRLVGVLFLGTIAIIDNLAPSNAGMARPLTLTRYGVPECVKCGGSSFVVSYRQTVTQEYLEVGCNHCGYETKSKCKDAL